MFRDFRLFIYPRLWAEEGTIYFQEAYTLGFKTIFESKLGYYSLFPRTFSYFATFFPLEFVPLVMTSLTMLIWLLPHVLISISKNKYLLLDKNKILFSLILIITSPSDEIFLNSINLHFLTPWILLLIGLDDLGQVSKKRKIFYMILAWLSILNGAVAIFVIPVYAYLLIIQKEYKFLSFSMSVTVIQIFCILSYSDANSIHDRFGFSLKEFSQTFYLRTLVNPYLGEINDTYSILNLIGIFNIPKGKNFVIFLLFCFFLYAIKRKNFFSAALIIGCLSVSLLTYSTTLNSKNQGLLLGSGRYFYLPNTMLSISFLLFAFQEIKLKKLKTLIYSLPLLLLIYSSGKEYFRTSPYCSECANWKTEVQENFKANRKIEIWPKGWVIDLNKSE
ncbi:hypothetical protein EHQ83_12420 [Leptospira yasudae]|uniref:DUF2079 domain-containing protein n=2 Tax=Leptospira yasudae TaxID=2202201 RepID=A0A6N4QXY0_9LEPT|nr:hypothetical protein EHQ72_12510 [Leptospira yasudae]TGL83884.1 hypothetical protein EHQ83_12420 [Leptospira yasudae]TGL84042.1 hypothetical protein EHQ77_00975 [Leptospira yasudae]